MKLNGRTRLPGVIRHPIDLILNPRMHNAVFAVGVMDYVYVPLDVRQERLSGRSPRARSGGETSASSIDLVGEASAGARAIVNNSYLGMKDEDDLASAAGCLGPTLDADRIVCNAVYRAGSETSLNKIAREQGARELTGGREPNVEAMEYALA